MTLPNWTSLTVYSIPPRAHHTWHVPIPDWTKILYANLYVVWLKTHENHPSSSSTLLVKKRCPKLHLNTIRACFRKLNQIMAMAHYWASCAGGLEFVLLKEVIHDSYAIPVSSHCRIFTFKQISGAGLSGISSANEKTETKNAIITFRLVWL